MGGASVSDTLSYSTGCWVQKISAVAPSERQSATLVYYPDIHLSLLLGGRKDDPHGPQTVPGDAWTWDGQLWSQVVGAPHFSDAVGTYDQLHRVVVVLGSAPEGIGTWTWDGKVWRLVTAQGPGIRANPAMCFSRSSNSVLLFGGAGSGTPLLGDTWLWNGTMWSEEHPVHVPPPRFEAAIACGAKTLLFGGWGSYQGLVLADTWAWDGSDWTQLSPSAHPAPALVMPFGVSDGSNEFVFAGMTPSQIWTWNGSAWAASA